MRIGVKFAAHPTKEQKQIFAQWSGCARVIYNAKVEEDRYYRRFRHTSAALTGHPIPNSTDYAQFKDDEFTPWLSECPSQILRNSAVIWRDALERYHQGLGGLPKKKRKGNKASITLTRELFEFAPQADGTHKLLIGTKKFPFGELSFSPHRGYVVPNVIVISRHNDNYFVSFSYEKSKVEAIAEPELLAHLQTLTPEQLEQAADAYDRGVVIPVQSASGASYDFSPEQKRHIERIRKHIAALQKKLAKQIKVSKQQAKQANVVWYPSKRQERTKQQIANLHAKLANIRHDFAHKTSHAITEQPNILLHIFEALLVTNMTKKPKAKQDENGKWMRNGARAKAGLNASILLRCWGYILSYTKYKAARKGQLVVTVPPHHSSQECAQCGYTHPDNRITQSLFICQSCGHVANADENASAVIKKRGVQLVLAAEIVIKAKKKTGSRIRKKTTPQPILQNVPGGTRGHAQLEIIRHGQEGSFACAVLLNCEPAKSTATRELVV